MNREDILNTASLLIHGDRAKDYGDAKNNFEQIATAWNWWLDKKISSAISPEDVAMMMVLLKMARLQSNHLHADSYYDLIGYAALAGEISLSHGVQEKMEK